MFFVFIGITFIVSLSLLLYRWTDLSDEGVLYSLLSRESLFLLNNLLFMGILIVCFSGVIFPLVSELLTGQKVTVGPPFYERATGPLFAGLLLLMGIAPLSAWGHSTVKTWKSLVDASTGIRTRISSGYLVRGAEWLGNTGVLAGSVHFQRHFI
jgi:cytochrome c-type biogenesis protein CcmF